MSEQLQLEDEEIPILLRRAWDRALRSVALRVNKGTFEGHIRAIRPVALTEQTNASGRPVYEITLGVPNPFTREWVEKRHSVLIASVLEEILDRDVQLRFVVTARPAATASPSATLRLFEDADDDSTAAAPKATTSRLPSPTGLISPEKTALNSLFASDATPTAPPASPSRRKSNGTTPAKSPDAPATTVATTSPTRRRSSETPALPEGPSLNAKYTFDSFVLGSSNRLAHAGAQAVAQAPGQVYNPLFLYGPPGLGKTHLMHAIGHEIARTQGEAASGRVAYISGETFTSHFIASLRDQRAAEEFRRKWRTVDVWLVDDIQFIAGKESTKEEFFHTFNALYQGGKQIVISSDRSPRELRMMDERLRSRFECGLIADIAPPDLETRLAILQRKAETERTRIPDDVLIYMARLIQSNIRTLEGALVRLIAYASLSNSPVTTDLAAGVLERYFIAAGGNLSGAVSDAPTGHTAGYTRSRGGERTMDPHPADGVAADSLAAFAGRGAAVTPEMVQRVVAQRFGLSTDALTGKKRDRDVVAARQVAMHLMRELTQISLPGIGQLFGGRDHSTVMHACDKVRSQLPMDDDLKRLIEDLTVQLRAARPASE